MITDNEDDFDDDDDDIRNVLGCNL